jgi:hypothetical protein
MTTKKKVLQGCNLDGDQDGLVVDEPVEKNGFALSTSQNDRRPVKDFRSF